MDTDSTIDIINAWGCYMERQTPDLYPAPTITANETQAHHTTEIQVHLLFMGRFSGTVKYFCERVDTRKSHAVQFEDTELENSSEEELAQHKKEASIPVGDVGFQFICKFLGSVDKFL